MTNPDNYEIKGIGACKWVIIYKPSGKQLETLVFGSKVEAEFGLEEEIEYLKRYTMGK